MKWHHRGKHVSKGQKTEHLYIIDRSYYLEDQGAIIKQFLKGFTLDNAHKFLSLHWTALILTSPSFHWLDAYLHKADTISLTELLSYQSPYRPTLTDTEASSFPNL